mgnify:FL=1
MQYFLKTLALRHVWNFHYVTQKFIYLHVWGLLKCMHKQCPQYSVIYIRYIYLEGVLFWASYSHLIILKILRTLGIEDFKASF